MSMVERICRVVGEPQPVPEGRLSIEPLLAVLSQRDPEASMQSLCRRLGYESTPVYRWLQTGLDVFAADKLAVRVGYHPICIWPTEWLELAERRCTGSRLGRRERGSTSAIRDAREALWMTQADLALEVGVHKSTIRWWESERTLPSAEHAERLLEVLGISVPCRKAKPPSEPRPQRRSTVARKVSAPTGPPTSIREAREARGLAQWELAGELGVMVKTVADWEASRYQPDVDQASRIYSVLGFVVDSPRLRVRPPRPRRESNGFGARLLRARRAAGMSQRDVALAIGAGQNGATIGRWEADRRMPSPETVRKLAEVLGTQADVLLGTATT